MTPGLRRLYIPRPVAVRVGPGGAPAEVEGITVVSVREEWLVEDRWWTPRPLRRHYFELALADGRAIAVFRRGRSGDGDGDGDGDGRWYRQRA